MKERLRLPSPAMIVACLALFVAMGGTAIAAPPVVKRALYADNAGKLQGRKVADLAAMPGPASTAAGLISLKNSADSLGAEAGREFSIACDAGKKIVSGGYSTTGPVVAFDSRPTNDTTWGLFLANLGNQGAQISLYAVCIG